MPFKDTENPSFFLSSSRGMPVLVSGMSLPYHCIDIELTCEKGRISILAGGMQSRVEIKAEHELFPGFFRLKEGESNVLGQNEIENAVNMALDDLIMSYQQKKGPQSNLATFRKTLAIIEGVEEAVRSFR